MHVTGSPHSITAVYSGDTNNPGSTSAATLQTVTQASSTITLASSSSSSVFGQGVGFTATVSPQYGGTPTGTVTFLDNGSSIGTATVNTGSAMFTATSLAAGSSHTITAVYGGSSDIAASPTSAAQTETVSRATTTTTVTALPNPADQTMVTPYQTQTVTLTATVSPQYTGTPTGTVTFSDGSSILGTGTINGSGVATFSTNSLLSVGTHTIKAAYSSDTNFFASTSAAYTQAIRRYTSTTVASAPNPSSLGQSVTFTATVSGSGGTPTGTVTFNDGATNLGTGSVNGSGTATLTTSALAGGMRTITATYGGDAVSGVSTGSMQQSVNRQTTTSTLTSSSAGNTSVFGASVTFSVTVAVVSPGTGTPTGTVTFSDGSTSLGTASLSGGVATVSTSTLTTASHTILAIYGGDSNNQGSTSASLMQTVNKASTGSTLTSSNNPAVVNQPVTFTATVSVTPPGSGTAGGTVTFEDGTTVLGSGILNGGGVATFSSSSLSAATHTITAVYSGDANFAGSTSPILLQTVNQQSVNQATAYSGMLVFNDDFNQAAGSQPNTSIWGDENGSDPNNGGVHYVNTTQTLQVVNDSGALDGKALALSLIPQGGGVYNSAEISTYVSANSGMHVLYGHVEARIKICGDGSGGVWPAFWMLGDNIKTGTGWPTCGEIDIMENWAHIPGKSSPPLTGLAATSCIPASRHITICLAPRFFTPATTRLQLTGHPTSYSSRSTALFSVLSHSPKLQPMGGRGSSEITITRSISS